MKNIVKLLAVFALVALSFSSCKKCVSCKVERLNGILEAEYEEFCGTDDEIDEFKKSIRTKLNAVPNTQTIVIICTDK